LTPLAGKTDDAFSALSLLRRAIFERRRAATRMEASSMTELDYWKDRLQIGAISRREFIGRAAALGASSALVSTMLGAVEAHAAETVKKGGTIRLGLAGGSTTDSIEPGSYTDSVMIAVGHGLFNALVEWAADGTTKPELATSWEAKDGAKTWIINLRKGIKFSNGQEFTADDAVYSLNLHRGDTKSGAAGVMKPITDVKKLDKYQIQISLDAPDADFPYILTDYHLLMVPDGFKDWSKPIGTGGYVLDKFDPGVRIAVKKAPDYWRAGEGRGNLDAAEITVIGDGSARLNALISGQIDAINRVDHKAVALLQKAPKTEIVRAPGGWFTVMAMEMDKPPYDNPDVRLALKYATDREQLLRALFSGYGTLGNDHPIPPSDPYFNKELPQRKHDPDKAAFHLKKSGLADPPIVLQASDAAFAGAVDMGTLLQASANKAGIKMQLKKEPADGFWDNVWLKGAFVSSYWGGRAAATRMLSVAFAAGAPWNETHWNNEKFEKLLADARGETDEAKRKPYIWEMQAMLNEQGGAIIPVFKDWLDAHLDKVGGHTPHGGFDMDNGYIMQKAWIKA
jgi:peptide/nickel transport system substrate-binding protein